MAESAVRPHLTPALRSGTLLWTSGQLPLSSSGLLVGDTVEEQTRQCLANLDAVLAAHALSRQHVVKTTVWLKRSADFVAFNAAYAQFFGDHRPARSTVCSELVLPAALVEIEAIAQCG
jgi:2-iminobutanoate/2-iminopropanoate deaminase